MTEYQGNIPIAPPPSWSELTDEEADAIGYGVSSENREKVMLDAVMSKYATEAPDNLAKALNDYWAAKTIAAETNALERIRAFDRLESPQPSYHETCEPPLDFLPSDKLERKATPICTGVLDYFPLAIAEVARISKAGNDQHGFGPPLRWVRPVSSDHADCIVRHLLDRGKLDSDGQRHTAKLAWRALALLQEELENK